MSRTHSTRSRLAIEGLESRALMSLSPTGLDLASEPLDPNPIGLEIPAVQRVLVDEGGESKDQGIKVFIDVVYNHTCG